MIFFLKFTSSLLPVVPYDKEAAKMRDGLTQWLENPRVTGCYSLAGTRSTVTIWDGESVEQLHIDIMTSPCHRLGEWEIHALVDNRNPGNWAGRLGGLAIPADALQHPPGLAGVMVSDAACSAA
jgi:hypothetical protein